MVVLEEGGCFYFSNIISLMWTKTSVVIAKCLSLGYGVKDVYCKLF